MTVERADIKVLADNQIYSINLSSKSMLLSDAALEVDRLCQVFGIDVKGFVDYINGIGKAGNQAPRSGLLATKGKTHIQVICSFPPMEGAQATVMVLLTWPPSNQITKPHLGLIQPPPGYEDVSMDPPPLDEEGNPWRRTPDGKGFQPPSSSSAISGQGGVNTATPGRIGSSGTKQSSTTPALPKHAQLSSSPTVAQANSSIPLGVWVLGGVLIMAGLWWLMRKR